MFRRPTSFGTATFLKLGNMILQFDINNKLTWTDPWLWTGTCDKTNFGLDVSNPFLNDYLTENKNRWNYYEFSYAFALDLLKGYLGLTINNANSNSLTCTTCSDVTVGLSSEFYVNLDNFFARNLGVYFTHGSVTSNIPNLFYMDYYNFNMRSFIDIIDNYCVSYIFENMFYNSIAKTFDDLCGKVVVPQTNTYNLM